MKGSVYKLDFPNGKSYIGITIKEVPKRYREHANAAERGSPASLHCAWREYGAPKLTRLKYGLSPKSLLAEERRLIQKFDTLTPNGHNMTPGGGSGTHSHTAAAKEKISTANLGRHHTAEAKAKISKAHKGSKHSEETKAKIAAASKKRRHSAETRAKISNALKGRKFSAETRKRISLAKIGKKHTPEHKEKNRQAQFKRYAKHPMSEETKEKCRQAALKTWLRPLTTSGPFGGTINIKEVF